MRCRVKYIRKGSTWVNNPVDEDILINGGKILKPIIREPIQEFAILMNKINNNGKKSKRYQNINISTERSIR